MALLCMKGQVLYVQKQYCICNCAATIYRHGFVQYYVIFTYLTETHAWLNNMIFVI